MNATTLPAIIRQADGTTLSVYHVLDCARSLLFRCELDDQLEESLISSLEDLETLIRAIER